MPLVSQPPFPGFANLSDLPVVYVLLGASLLVLLGTYISRRTRSSRLPILASSPSQAEKGSLMSNSSSMGSAQSASFDPVAKPRIQRPPQPPPFTPPMPEPTEMNFSSSEPAMDMAPRRRSYTKTMSDGTEVSGEIIVAAEGWRRHTKVFGGGVCRACEESERRLSA